MVAIQAASAHIRYCSLSCSSGNASNIKFLNANQSRKYKKYIMCFGIASIHYHRLWFQANYLWTLRQTLHCVHENVLFNFYSYLIWYTLIGGGQLNPLTNGVPVGLEICGVMIHSTSRPITMTWQASALHVISLFEF